ncbi:phosphatase 2C-like domain-containing protein [Scleroderma yunnanense]
MLRRVWKPVAATTLFVAAPSYLYYHYHFKQRTSQTVQVPVRIRGEDGQPTMATRVFPLLSQSTVDERLREHAKEEIIHRSGRNWRINTASVAANDPIEDAHAHVIVTRDPDDPLAPGDWLFFAIMDGHAGPHTSRLLSKTLVNAVMLELSSLIHDTKASRWFSTSKVQNPDTISLAIQNAFTKLDHELINAPLRVLAENMDKEVGASQRIPDLSGHPLALPLMLPAVSGSCALMAVIDTAQRNLYIACSGDSRAVAGVWEENENGGGSWRVEVLSEDQTGRNPNEHKRMQSEHPPEEAEKVIIRGRVLGGLEPTRAFGDARYKWSREVQDVLSSLNTAFLVGNNKPLRPAPASLKTPPYVTATPVVTHRDLTFGDFADENSSAPSTQLKPSPPCFVVLATDGLWDKLSSEEVVALVGGALQGLSGTIPKIELSSLVPTAPGSTSTVEGKDKHTLKDMDKKQDGSWSFDDDNLSVHLIRNAFGGGDRHAVKTLMSIPYPHARRYRDDTTVTVVVWDDNYEGPGRNASANRRPEEKGRTDSGTEDKIPNNDSGVKAKL